MTRNVCCLGFKWSKLTFGGSLLPRLRLSLKPGASRRSVHLPVSSSALLPGPRHREPLRTAPCPSAVSRDLDRPHSFLPLLAHLPRLAHWPLPVFPSFLPFLPSSHCLPRDADAGPQSAGPATLLPLSNLPEYSFLQKRSLMLTSWLRHCFLYLLPTQTQEKTKKRNHK